MDGLVRCERCGHGATIHDAGCEVARCGCRATREDVVAAGIAAAREEIRRLWERPVPLSYGRELEAQKIDHEAGRHVRAREALRFADGGE